MTSDIENIRECLEYCSETGIIKWTKTDSRTVKPGHVAGGATMDGYIGIKVRGKIFRAHRVAWLLHYGEWPKNQIDHKNRIKTDNRISNLRDVSNFQNHQNRSDNKSGVVGVCWHKQSQKWEAQIRFRKKIIRLGTYEKIESAAKIRREAESYYHGVVHE